MLMHTSKNVRMQEDKEKNLLLRTSMNNLQHTLLKKSCNPRNKDHQSLLKNNRSKQMELPLLLKIKSKGTSLILDRKKK